MSASYTPTPLQRRPGGSSSPSTSSSAFHMPRPFSQPGLPLPSMSRRRSGGVAGFLQSFSPRLRKRATLGIIAVVTLFLLSLMTGSGPSSTGLGGSATSWSRDDGNSHARVHNGGANNAQMGFQHEPNSISEDQLLAENEIAIDNEPEAVPQTEDEKRAEREAAQQQQLSQAEEKKKQLRTLVWWLNKGGEFPGSDSGYTPPTLSQFNSMTGEEFVQHLVTMDGAVHPTPSPFEDPEWATDADIYLDVTIFSKSYCPYSKTAKKIIAEYSAQPNIVELDQRSDGSTIQDILKSLTGRRTVPNVIAHFEPIGGADELTLLHGEGTLERKLLYYSRNVQ